MGDQRTLEPAPVRLRLAAAGLSFAGIVPLAVPAVGLVWGVALLDVRRRRAANGEAVVTANERVLEYFNRWQPGLTAFNRADRLLYPNRSFGAQVMGLRSVDIHTGGTPRLLPAIGWELTDDVSRWLIRQYLEPRLTRWTNIVTDATAEVEAELGPRDELDPVVFQQALTAKTSGAMNCGPACAVALAPSVLQFATIPLTRRRQRLGQIVSGTMVIRSRTSPTSARL